MHVTKYGDIKPKKLECRSCGATLSYTPMDVKTKNLPRREYHYVVCPVCGVNTEAETWKS